MSAHDYCCGIFIGGMEGVEDVFDLFRTLNIKSAVFRWLVLGGHRAYCFTVIPSSSRARNRAVGWSMRKPTAGCFETC